MSNYEASGANYSLWEFESAGSRSARDSFWHVSVKAQHGGTDLLSFFLAGATFLPSPQCIPGRSHQREKKKKREKRSLRARVLATLKPNCFSSPSKLATKLSRFSSSFFFHFLLRQMPQISVTAASDPFFKIIFYIYVCVLPVVVILFTSWRKVRRGQDLLQVLQGALCAAESTLHWVHQAVMTIFPPCVPAGNPGQAHPGVTPGRSSVQPCPGWVPQRCPRARPPADSFPATPWLSQVRIRGSATEELVGIFIHVKTPANRACMGSMPCPSPPLNPMQRHPGIWVKHRYQLGNSAWARAQSVPDD